MPPAVAGATHRLTLDSNTKDQEASGESTCRGAVRATLAPGSSARPIDASLTRSSPLPVKEMAVGSFRKAAGPATPQPDARERTVSPAAHRNTPPDWPGTIGRGLCREDCPRECTALPASHTVEPSREAAWRHVSPCADGDDVVAVDDPTESGMSAVVITPDALIRARVWWVQGTRGDPLPLSASLSRCPSLVQPCPSPWSFPLPHRCSLSSSSPPTHTCSGDPIGVE